MRRPHSGSPADEERAFAPSLLEKDDPANSTFKRTEGIAEAAGVGGSREGCYWCRQIDINIEALSRVACNYAPRYRHTPDDAECKHIVGTLQ